MSQKINDEETASLSMKNSSIQASRASSLCSAQQPSGKKSSKQSPPVYDFLTVFVLLLALTSWIEANASSHHCTNSSMNTAAIDGTHEKAMITDIGFVWTQNLHDHLTTNQSLNDWLAFGNSLVLLIPLIYSFCVTTVLGDYELIFRIVAAQVLRSLCGWLTYLPPHAEYLASNYDYPDIVNCLFEDCKSTSVTASQPFISFYSGHVANLVICGNDMWMRGVVRSRNDPRRRYYGAAAVAVHIVNALQIVRMLATRGHYTIDLLMGWVVAVYVTGRAGQMGRIYSKGGTALFCLFPACSTMCSSLRTTVTQTWEFVTGLGNWQHELTLDDETELAQYNPEKEELLFNLNHLQRQSFCGSEDERTETTCSLGSFNYD